MITKTRVETKVIKVEKQENYATFEDLEKFLRSENVLREFMINFYRYHSAALSLDIKQLFNEYCLMSESFILGAFPWRGTEEGCSFWSKIDKQFRQWCQENDIKGFIKNESLEIR